MEKKRYRVKKKNNKGTNVENFTTDSFVNSRVNGVKNLVKSNVLSFNEQKKQDELKALVAQIPQMMQYGGQPYEDTSYSYVDNTVNNIRSANQGIQDSQQGMRNAFGDIQDVFADYSMQQGYLPMAKNGMGNTPPNNSFYDFSSLENNNDPSYLENQKNKAAILNQYEQNNPNFTTEEKKKPYISPSFGERIEHWLDRPLGAPSISEQRIIDIESQRLSDELKRKENQKNTTGVLRIPGSPGYGENSGDVIPPVYKPTAKTATQAAQEAEVEAKSNPKTSAQKTKTQQEKVDEALSDTPKAEEVKTEEAKLRGNTTAYTESGKESKGTAKTENLQNTVGTPRYGTPMGRFKMKGRDAAGKRYKIKYNTAGGPMDMYGNPANVVKGYYGSEADRFRNRFQPQSIGRDFAPIESVEDSAFKNNRRRNNLKEELFESVEDTDARLNRDQGGYDELERYRKIEEAVRNNPPTRPDINDEDRDLLMADNMGQGTPVQFQFGGSNEYAFGQGDASGFNPNFNVSMGDKFQPMTFAEKQGMKDGTFVSKDFSDLTVGDDYAQDPYDINAKTKWKKAGMNAGQIADLSLAGLKGATQYFDNRRFREDKENQYTGADAFASIGNASNMNQGRFDSGNMSGGAFSDRTPVQFAQYGVEVQDNTSVAPVRIKKDRDSYKFNPATNPLSEDDLRALAHQKRGMGFPSSSYVKEHNPVMNDLGRLSSVELEQLSEYMDQAPMYQSIYEGMPNVGRIFGNSASDIPNNSKLKRNFQDGGEYELTEQEIQEIINNGGYVEYL